MVTSDSFVSRLASALRFDRSLYAEVEADPGAMPQAAVVVVLAGAGRGVSPMFEAGWAPIVGHALAGLLIWLAVTVLVWNVAHRLLGYAEGLREFARVLAFAASPLLLLWIGVLPIPGFSPWLSLAIHAAALSSLVIAIRVSLDTSLPVALGICALSLGTAVLIFLLIGVFLVGTPASGDRSGPLAVFLSSEVSRATAPHNMSCEFRSLAEGVPRSWT
jgi:hypothetical protein